MYNILVSTENLPHEDWLAYRNLGIGGSDASVVCGINRWKSPVELYMEKKSMFPPVDAGEAAYWGNRLEGLVREEFTLRTGIEVMPVNAILQSEEYPFMLANLDGYCYHPQHGEIIFEAKTAGQYMSSEWDDDKIPNSYMLQLQHYMAVTGFRGAYIAVLIGGNNFKWQFVERDEELISMLIQLEAEFWDGVQSGTPPALDGSDASVKLLSKHFPDSVPQSTIELPRTAMALVEQHNHASDKIGYYTEQKQEAENLLKQMMGDNEVGIISGHEVCAISGCVDGDIANENNIRGGYAYDTDENDGAIGNRVSGDVGYKAIGDADYNADGVDGVDGVVGAIDADGASDVNIVDYENPTIAAKSDVGNKVIISWKSFTQERLDTKTIKAEHPTLCSKYSNRASTRRFSIKSA